MIDIETQVRALQGADFPPDPEPKVSGLWLTIGGGALFLAVCGLIGWGVFA